ncbi:MAG: TIGR03826 family flagellar region protein [Sporolactobacillus sp.]
MAELANCKDCGKLFVRMASPYCPQCLEKQERQFDTVYQYIVAKKHRMAAVPEVHEATKVPVELIYQWIREGRLKTSLFPNLGYPCRSCGKLITSGTLCDDCQRQMTDDIRRSEAEQDVLKRTLERTTYHTQRNGGSNS